MSPELTLSASDAILDAMAKIGVELLMQRRDTCLEIYNRTKGIGNVSKNRRLVDDPQDSSCR